ncbi:MAG TPA: DUF5103 domain-containing protein, partial [Flavobacteriia bacterium]|nr:DUF5103 domain-containing protein [Flavobacteriia bacterium]
LKFDDTEGDQKDYHYTIIHCTYDWKNSNLNPTDYSNGFAEDRIRNFDNSFNTFLDYTHYELTLPNTQVQLKITGNYLISIYDEYDDLIFTRKFIVYEPKVDVGVSVHKAKKVSNINTKQNVEFTINHPNFRFDNPSQEVKTTLYRNIDWNSKISNVKPQFIRNGQLLYKYDTETTFWAGNEFLFFDTKEYRIATNNIRRSELKNGIFHTRLYVDETRARKPYTYYPDINGNFVIRSLNTENPNFEAEYTQVHFFLDYSNPDKKEVYVYGAFNNWQLNEENLMHYNEATKLYETSFLFKQGFYNYYYVTLDEDESINIVDVNGSFYQTENDYQVLVYYHKFGAKYDEVIGLGIGNSVNLQN